MEPSTLVIDPAEGLFQGPSWDAYRNHLVSKEALGGKVSKSSLQYHNRLGYYGIYQMGVQALEDIGYIKKGTYKKMRRNNQRQIDILGDENNWTGGRNLKWFTDEEVQNEALREFTQKNYTAIQGALKEGGYDTPGAIYGWLTAAHLGGAGNTKKYIKTGKSSFKDANNTSMKKYRDSFSNYYSKHVGEDTPRNQVVRGDSYKGSLPIKYDDGKISAAADLIMGKIDLGQSTFSREDVKEMRGRIESILGANSGSGLNPDGGFIDKAISLAYDNTDQTELREILVPDVKTTTGVEMLEPANMKEIEALLGDEDVKRTPDGQMAYGGTIQPNGRKTTFSRPEDQKAQGKTTK